MKKMPAEYERIFFRKAEYNDVEKMTELDEICFSVPWSKEDFEKEMKSNPLALYILAEREDGIIGYAGLWCIIDEGHITNVAVHPDFRRMGLGRSIVEVLINEAQEKAGIESFTLEVRASNVAGIRLYKNIGFVEAGIRRGYYTDNREDALIMWLIGN